MSDQIIGFIALVIIVVATHAVLKRTRVGRSADKLSRKSIPWGKLALLFFLLQFICIAIGVIAEAKDFKIPNNIGITINGVLVALGLTSLLLMVVNRRKRKEGDSVCQEVAQTHIQCEKKQELGRIRKQSQKRIIVLTMITVLVAVYAVALWHARSQTQTMVLNIEKALTKIEKWNNAQSLGATSELDQIGNYLYQTEECRALIAQLSKQSYELRNWKEEIHSKRIPQNVDRTQVWALVAKRNQAKLKKDIVRMRDRLGLMRSRPTEYPMVPVSSAKTCYPTWETFVLGIDQQQLLSVVSLDTSVVVESPPEEKGRTSRHSIAVE